MCDIETNNLKLYARVLAALESPDEALALLRELYTPQEIRATAQRLAIAELLIQKTPYVKIRELLGDKETKGPSTSTVGRINETVQYGGGHLKKMITRVNGVEGS